MAGAFDVFLLAGGRSARMGRDKATLEIAGTTFVEAIAAAARPLARTIRLVGRTGAVGGLDAIPDLRPGLGPLTGIETALTHAETPTAILIACDLPLVSTALIELLADRAAASHAIAVAADATGRVAPLCGLYPVAALETTTRLLDAGERRPRALLDAVASLVVPFEEYRHLPGAPDLLRNVNTPEEYEGIRGRGSAVGQDDSDRSPRPPPDD